MTNPFAIAEPTIAQTPIPPQPFQHPEWKPEHVNLCGVYPAPLSAVRHRHQIITYTLPAAPRGSYSLLPVYTTYEWIRNPMDLDNISMMPAPVEARHEAEKLIREWTGDTLLGGRIGIGIIKGERPTEEEFRSLWAEQEIFAREAVRQADIWYEQKDYRAIGELHKLMADWLGLQDRPWKRQQIAVSLKACLACAKEIRQQAIVCDLCGTNLVEFALKNPWVPLEQDVFITAQVEKAKEYLKLREAVEAPPVKIGAKVVI